MKQGVVLVLVLAAVAAIIVLSVKQPSAAPAMPAEAPLTQEKILAFIDQCSSELLGSGRDYVVCSLDGNFVQLKDSSIFRPGELFSVQANLQRLSKYDAYYICWSQGSYEKAPSPKRFTEHPQFDGTYLGREFSCSSDPFYQKDFHLIAAKGFAPSGKGKFFVIDAYIFPDGNYKSADDFLARMDEAKKVFSFEGDVA